MEEQDINKLRKIVALFDSSNEGERNAAVSKASALLKRHGLRMVDLPTVLSGAESKGTAQTTPSPSNGESTPHNWSSNFDDFMEAKEPGYKARAAAEQAARQRAEEAYRRSVIAKYGSESNALASTAIERAIDDAVRPFERTIQYKYSKAEYPRRTLDGWYPYDGDPPPLVAARVRGAWPLPTTIVEAKSEYDLWVERSRERRALLGDTDDFALSIGCELRRMIIYDLLHYGFRATSASDAILRLRSFNEQGSKLGNKEINSLLADLESLVEQERLAVHIGQQTTSGRRRDVEQLLADPRTANLPDREIARRVGVSPQTVGNIRRRSSMAKAM